MTPSPHSLTVAAVAVLSVSALGSATAQAATDVEPLTAATPVAAYRGTAMWSRLDAATGKYQLVQAIDGGAPTLVAVPQRDGAFDIDLGTNRAGSTYAVYSRRGDLFRLNPRTAIEKRLTKLSAPGQAERSPAIRRGRIAFVRRVGGRDQLRIGDTTTGSKATRLLLTREGIESVALGISQVSWIDRVTNGLPSSRYRVHIRNIATGKDQIVYEAGGGGASFTTITKPIPVTSTPARSACGPYTRKATRATSRWGSSAVNGSCGRTRTPPGRCHRRGRTCGRCADRLR